MAWGVWIHISKKFKVQPSINSRPQLFLSTKVASIYHSGWQTKATKINNGRTKKEQRYMWTVINTNQWGGVVDDAR